MIRAAGCLLVFAATAAAGYVVTLHRIPSTIMSTAMSRMEEGGVNVHDWRTAPRTTPQSQTIVRPSPDLAYSVCRFDVSAGPVLISGAEWGSYASLSLYDSATNNIFTTSLRSGSGEPNAVIVALERDAGRTLNPPGAPLVKVRNPRGLALLRRLAVTQTDYDTAAALSGEDQCAPL